MVNAQGMHSHPPRSMPLPATVAAGGGGGGSGYAGTPVLQLQSLAAVPATMNAQLYASSSRIPPPSPSWGVGNVGLLPSPRSLELGREDQADLFTISPENYAAFSGMFDSVDVNGSGFLSGAQARPVLTNSGLPTSDLRKIWDLADAEKDGMLDRHEYIICQFLIKHRLAGHELPTTLPAALQPKTLSSRMQGKGGGGGGGGRQSGGGGGGCHVLGAAVAGALCAFAAGCVAAAAVCYAAIAHCDSQFGFDVSGRVAWLGTSVAVGERHAQRAPTRRHAAEPDVEAHALAQHPQYVALLRRPG